MSWTNDIRCLYCDGKLPLYRKLTSGQFCSASHSQAYWQEQERLAVERLLQTHDRLHQTHDALHAHRPPEAISGAIPEAIEAEPVPEFGGLIPLALKSSLYVPAGVLGGDPLTIEIISLMHSPSWRFQSCAARGLSMAILMPLDISIRAPWLEGGKAVSEPRPLECLGVVSGPTRSALRIQRELMLAGPLALALAGRIPAAAPGFSAVGEATPLGPNVQPLYPSYVAASPHNEELYQLRDDQVPHADKLLLLSRPAARAGTNRIAEDAGQTTPIFVDSPPQFPSCQQNERVPRVNELLLLSRPAARAGTNRIAEDAGQTTPIATSLAPQFPSCQQNERVPRVNELLLLSHPAARAGTHRIAEDAGQTTPIFTSLPPQFPSYRQNERVPRVNELLLLSRPAARAGTHRIAEDAGQTTPIFSNLPPQFPSYRRDERVPRVHELLLLSGPAARAGTHRIAADAGQTTPIFTSLPPQFPAGGASPQGPAPIALMQAGLSRLFIDHIPLVHGTWIDNLRAVELSGGAEAPPLMLATPSLRPHLRLAASSRCPVETRESEAAAPAGVEPAGFFTASPSISLPLAGAQCAPSRIPAPGVGRLLPLTLAAGGRKPGLKSIPAPRLSRPVPQPLSPDLICPRLKLEPIETLPPGGLPAASAEIIRRSYRWAYSAAIPVLVGLALYAWAPKADGGIPRAFESAVNTQFANVRRTVLDRAAVALNEDFRAGLDDWSSRDGAATDWSFDATGFVRPGPLALYRPSLGLRDYQMQFLGLIDKKALSWVVRAADFRNYYVVKLVVLKAGPLPRLGVTRYAVVNGRADSRVETMAAIDARPDTLYRVRMDVRGDSFLLTVQGQIVDNWSEPRLKHGGVGLFSGAGEASRVRWVQVTHQYDVLGRLCAYLAPYDFQMTNGSWK